MSSARTRALAVGRRGLAVAANRSRLARLTYARIANELRRALPDDTYDGGYFGEGRNPCDRMGLSGYERYDRFMSNADVAAYLVWRFLPGQHTLDCGCAFGFVVEALRELDVDAEGVDVSYFAIDHASPGARGHVRQGSLLDRLPFDDASFDVVTALETLEHLPPESIPAAIGELRRVSGGYLLATIPTFGPNANGPGGWYNGKVRDERLAHYQQLPDTYEGPIPYDDLACDSEGNPLEGHLTIASYGWWTKQFEAAGFERCGEIERRIHPHLARFGLTKYWCLYVLRVPRISAATSDVRSPAEIEALEERWGLNRRPNDPADFDAVEAALGR
jgi:2-polyprenyl-3-methyl-5-hydroxy-6-metoxy-1,4-benzoquinol methylase